MPSVVEQKGRVIENSAFILTGHVVDPDTGEIRLPAEIASVKLKVHDVTIKASPTLVVPDGEDEETYDGDDLAPADCFLSELNTTSLLAEGTDGFNFRHDLHGDYVPEGDRVYRVEVKVTPAEGFGDPLYLLWRLESVAVFSE